MIIKDITRCCKAVSLVNMFRHMKTCQGNMFQCDQCDKTTKTSHGLRSHKLKFHEAPCIEKKTLLVKGRRRFGETQNHMGLVRFSISQMINMYVFLDF